MHVSQRDKLDQLEPVLDFVAAPFRRLGGEAYQKAHCRVRVKLGIPLHSVTQGDECFYPIKAAREERGRPQWWQAHPPSSVSTSAPGASCSSRSTGRSEARLSSAREDVACPMFHSPCSAEKVLRHLGQCDPATCMLESAQCHGGRLRAKRTTSRHSLP